ncbi:V-set and immunoglobulin domain-containing protein 10-like [Sphaerodactylus townsendi]|nr:V-set and immunoglobulin domain-containing protein 10-like [Sphaerodactylus townsendi]
MGHPMFPAHAAEPCPPPGLPAGRLLTYPRPLGGQKSACRKTGRARRAPQRSPAQELACRHSTQAGGGQALDLQTFAPPQRGQPGMARCWQQGTCLSTALTGWLLALLASALPSTCLDRLAGDNVSLAIPFSLPAPEMVTTIAWKKNQINVATGYFRPNFSVVVDSEYLSRFHVDPISGGLNITALKLSDSDVYTVVVVPVGSVESKADVTLKVYEKIHSVSVTVSPTEVFEGNRSVTLNCGPVQGSVTWTKDGQTLGEDPRYVLTDGSLKISHPQRADAGNYGCTISNPFSNGTSTAQLTIYYGPDTPRINVSSTDPDADKESFVLVNTSVNLTCLAPSQPPAEIYWNVADPEDNVVPSSPSLLLPSVQLNQAGTYSCLAINRRTKLQVRSTYRLTVAQRPTGSPHCSVSSTNNGTALLFACSWPGGFPDPHLSFLGLPVNKEVTSSHLEHLEVSPFPAGLSGQNITCLANHLTGQRQCSIIPEAPSGVFLSFQASEDTRRIVTMEMDCQGTFNPAEIGWLRSGHPLASDGDRFKLSPDGTRLSISNFTTPQDLGNYSANCTNPLGFQDANLTLIGPTISEWDLSRGTEAGSAHIAWKVPSGSVVTGFQIQMQGPRQARSASQWETIQELEATNRSTTVMGLQSQSSYSFRVVPLLGSQAGNPSQVLTLQPEPHLSPGAIAGIVIGSLLGFILILALLILLICFVRRARNQKVPPTPPENRHHYLSRQFPHGKESNEPSWGNPRWSSGDSDIYTITYEEHLRRYGGPATLSFHSRDNGHCNSTSSLPQPGAKNIRSATQV